MKNTDRDPTKKTEPAEEPPEGGPPPKDRRPGGVPPARPVVPAPPDKPYPAGSGQGPQDSGDSGGAIPKPAEAFWGNLTDPFNNTTIPHRAKNAFTYGEILGRTLHGWRIKALSFLFAPSNATKIEIAATRGAIKGVGKGLVFVAPLSVIVDLADAFRKNQVGSAAFFQDCDMAVLGGVGGFLGGAAFDVLGFGVLASLGLTGIGLFVAAPVLFGLVGAGVLQLAGSIVNQQTRQGSFLYGWYPGSFLDRCVSSVTSWFSSLSGRRQRAIAPAEEQNSTREHPPLIPPGGPISTQLHDPSLSGRRPPARFDPPRPPDRRGPDAPAGASDGGDGGGPGGSGAKRPGRVGRGLRAVPVGGVLFENCHTVLTGIEELTGAYWDEDSQSVVLIGRESVADHERNLALPEIDADHLKVALRAAIRGEALGVSIDAPADYRYGDGGRHMPPSGTPFFVSYLGGCEKTLTGAIFFEADRIMKCLSMGRHNETRKPIQANVLGFRSTFDLHGQSHGSEGPSWHRFWFVVDHVELTRTPGTDTLAFGDVRIAVKTELEFRGASPGQFDDALDAQFAQHLTSHYDEYAAEFSVFARLKELAKVNALAQFLIDRNIDIDFGDLLDELPIEVSTPDTTPSLLRSELSRSAGFVRSHAMSGGVDFAVRPSYRDDVDGVASQMREIANASRSASVSEWALKLGTASLRANAVKLGTSRKLRLVETDHEFPLAGSLARLRLQRLYESNATAKGMYGPDWTVFVPWSLTVLCGSGKRREVLDPKNGAINTPRPILVLRHHKSGSAQVYRPLLDIQVNGHPAWRRMTSRTVVPGGPSFKYDPGDLIYQRDDRFVMEQHSRRHCFDAAGRLLEISSDSGLLARYVWTADNQLERLENQAGQGYSFLHSTQTGEVTAVQVSDGQTVHYSYGANAHLREVWVGAQRQSLYAYDLAQRLNEVSDASGAITRRFYYDTKGELLNGHALNTVNLPDGRKTTRLFGSDRLISLTDENGALAEFTYGTKGHLQSAFVRSPYGLKWRFEYSANGSLRRMLDPLGRAAEFDLDSQGEVVRVVFSDKTELAAKRDDQGRTAEVTASGDRGWRAVYGTDGLLNSVSGLAMPTIEVKRSLRGVAVMNISGKGRTPAEPTLDFLGLRSYCRLSGRDFSERMSRRLVGQHRIRRDLGPDGRSLSTVGPAGAVKVSTAERDLIAEVVEFL